MKGRKKTYRSYGNYYTSTAEVFYPKSVDELKNILHHAHETGRKITIAGSFHSFDNQNSGSDMVVSLKKMNSIRYHEADHSIEVGPGANWGNILKTAYKHFCVPFTTITGSKPTAGGTLSAHTNSVFSPGCGKEGKHCIEFDLLTTTGELITCSRNQHCQIFYGVIAGLGLLGFITRIKYQLFYIGYPFKIAVTGKIYTDIKDIETRFDIRASAEFKTVDDLGSQGSMFYFDGNTPKFGVYNRHYVRIKKPQWHFSPYFLLGIFTMFVVRYFPKYANHQLTKDETLPIHKKRLLKGSEKVYRGTIWADADYYYQKTLGKFFGWLGKKPMLYQNSYFIPNTGNLPTLFTQQVCELLVKYNLLFGMFDVMYIPKDEPFVLSASRYTDGFYINTTFFDKVNECDLMKFYAELNQLCDDMGGKMNLVKNLFIEPWYLEKMYGKEIQEMLELKKITDPGNLIQSNFFKQKFPRYFRD
jgi:decaprenylphospho-beta-D-ribofuranose 2-oxidase